MCKFQFLEYGHVAGGCWWWILGWNRMILAFPVLRFVRPGIDGFAFRTANVGRQMDHTFNVLWCREWIARFHLCALSLLILVINLKPQVNESHVSIVARGPCWDWCRCMCDSQYGPSIGSNSVYLTIPCAELSSNIVIMLLVHFVDHCEAGVEWIMRFHCCFCALLRFRVLRVWRPIWTVKWSKLLTLLCNVQVLVAMLKSCWWCIWAIHLEKECCESHVSIFAFGFYRNWWLCVCDSYSSVLCRMQTFSSIIWSCRWWIWVLNLEPDLGESHVSSVAFGVCRDLWLW